MIDSDYHSETPVGRSQVRAADGAEERPDRPASIDLAVAALLDHIAEDLAREYVRLMEHAAQEGGTERLPQEEEQEA